MSQLPIQTSGYVVFNGGKPIYLGKYDLDSTQEAYHRLRV